MAVVLSDNQNISRHASSDPVVKLIGRLALEREGTDRMGTCFYYIWLLKGLEYGVLGNQFSNPEEIPLDDA